MPLITLLNETRESVIETWRLGVSNNDTPSKNLDEAETINRSKNQMRNNPFAAQLLSKDTPIVAKDIIPSLFTEEPETILIAMLAMRDAGLEAQARQGARALLERVQNEHPGFLLDKERLKHSVWIEASDHWVCLYQEFAHGGFVIQADAFVERKGSPAEKGNSAGHTSKL